MKTRIFSAIIMLLIAIPLLIIGSLPFALLASILAVIGLHELYI